MTHDPTQHGGRTQQHVERNGAACEAIAEAIICLLVIAAVGWLVAAAAGWM